MNSEIICLQDCYIGGTERLVTFQQAFDLKPLGRDGSYLYNERSTVLESKIMQPQRFCALSPYCRHLLHQEPRQRHKHTF